MNQKLLHLLTIKFDGRNLFLGLVILMSAHHWATAQCTPPATASISPDPAFFCGGDNIFLTAMGGTSYAWSTGANTPSISVMIGGTYTVTVTNASGCTSTASRVVTALMRPSVNILLSGNPCTGNIQTLTAMGGTSYAWSTGANTPSIQTMVAGTYTVTVTGDNGCTASTSQSIIFNPPPTASISSSGSICQGGTQTLTAMGGTSYAWSTGSNVASINTMIAQTYTVTVTADNGCSSVTNFTVTDTNCNPANDIPTLSQWSLLILGSCLLIVGIISLRQHSFVHVKQS